MKAICADIGGTNANFCIAEIGDEIVIRGQKHEATASYKDFSDLILKFIEQSGEKIDCGCFAAAGPVKNQRIEMTNAKLVIDAKEIMRKTPLKQAFIINDFEAIGYATNVIASSEKKVLNQGKESLHAMKAAIGAGTGLGKSILFWREKAKAYIPYPSEGGHADFPCKTEEEYKIVKGIESPTYEDLLSGRGLEHLYRYYHRTKYSTEPRDLSAKEISSLRDSSPCCKETFKTFVKFYARCAKNYTLDLWAAGGIFIAGGIAASNSDEFETGFMEEFTSHRLPKFRDFLSGIPVTLITNYDISLKGAAFALKVHGIAENKV